MTSGVPKRFFVASTRPICYGSRMSEFVSHRYVVAIDPADIDFMGHVNNASYLKWVQAAVINHWQRFAPAEAVTSHP